MFHNRNSLELIHLVLHLLIFNPKAIPCEAWAIYKAKENRSLIFCFGNNTSEEKYFAVSQEGEKVIESLFK